MKPPPPIRTEPDPTPWYTSAPFLIVGGLSMLVALMVVMFYLANR